MPLDESNQAEFYELRRIWSAHDDPDIRRLALEVARYRRVLAEVDKLYKTVTSLGATRLAVI